MSLFKPKIYVKDIMHVNYNQLYKDGIRTIIFDLDNTIILVNEKYPTKETITFINKLSSRFKIIIASNNNQKRVSNACKDILCDYIYHACKPSKKIDKYFYKNNLKKEEMCLIGDQLVTDIYCGNRLGIKTILVDPMSTKDLKVTYFNRIIEKIIKKRINLKSGEYYGES